MMSNKEQALDRIEAVIAQGYTVQATNTEWDWIDPGKGHGFLARAEVLASDLLPAGHPYRSSLASVASNDPPNLHSVNGAIAILESLRDDIAAGYLTRFADLVSAEVFSDTLDQAEYLLSEGYKDPTASLVGAVLEDGLRRMARSHELGVGAKDSLGSLNKKLSEAGVYNDLIRKQISTWTELRNNADHGHFSQYSAAQVGEMLAWVRTFLAERLG